MEDVLQLLDVVRRELTADDARLELGGRKPSDETVWFPLEDGFRVVAVYDEEPPEPPAVLRERLELLVASFQSTFASPSRSKRRRPDPSRALDDALDVLSLQAGAQHALVIDDSSPVVWGCSGSSARLEDLEEAERAAEAIVMASALEIDLSRLLAGGEPPQKLPADLDRLVHQIRAAGPEEELDVDAWGRLLRCMAAVVALRETLLREPTSTRHSVHDPDLALLGRGFGGVYWLVLVFEGATFSELHAEAAMIHALPWIERLVEALPPIDPEGGGGRVFHLRALRPV